TPPLREGETVDVVGFATVTDDEGLSLQEALVHDHAAPPTPRATPGLPTLTTADAVRRLSPSEAERAYPIHLQAVVTYNDPETRLLFVQDDTAGIYVEAWRHIHYVEPGDVVEIDGQSARGAFAPIVDGPRLHVVRHGPLPP